MSEQYRAFVSYSHTDAYWGTWLQNHIERFKVPDRLRRRYSLDPRPLRPVFRDVENLAAAGDLGDVIRQALAKSRYLVVVCSPDAARSQWVNQEIEEFKKAHGNQNILCWVVDGGVPDAFPTALVRAGIEPLAVDPRRSGDGKRIALLKLIAGLLDVPFDELHRRELHERNARLGRITAASVAGMLATSSLAWYAIVSRQAAEAARTEANNRRIQAEELIDFMLGDLHQKLEPIGRLSLLEDVGDQAARYFNILPDENLTDKERLRRAKAMHQIGEVRFRAGDFSGARAAFNATLQEATRLYDADPDDADRIFELAQAHSWVGFANWYYQDLERAATHLESYLEYSKALIEKDPNNRDWQAEVGYALGNLGTLANERNEFEVAIEYFERSVEIFEQLRAETGDARYSYELSGYLSWLGSVYRRMGRLNEAEQNFARENTILSELVNEHDNAHWRYSRITAMRHLGEIYIDSGRLRQAIATLTDGLMSLAELRSVDPHDTHWQFGETVIQSRLALAHMYLGDLPAAGKFVDAAGRNADALLKIETDNPRWRELEQALSALRARYYAAKGMPGEAAEIASRLLARIKSSPYANHLAIAWAEVLISEHADSDDTREKFAKQAEARILEHFENNRSPDVIGPLSRARRAQRDAAQPPEARDESLSSLD